MAVCVLSVAAFSIGACATSARRLSENLQAEGFTICVYDDVEGADGPTVTVTDAESIEKLAQWIRDRPRAHASGDLVTGIVQQAFADYLGPFPETIRIEATCLRVNLPMFIELPVVLETRATPAAGWSKASWMAREEDVELQQWARARIFAEYNLLMERGQWTDASKE
jgi:hypothetical protein